VGAPSYRDELGLPIPPEDQLAESSRVVRRADGSLQLPKPAKLPAEAANFFKPAKGPAPSNDVGHPGRAEPTPPLDAPAVPIAHFGPFAVLGRLDKNSEADVYLAEDTRQGAKQTKVALRLLKLPSENRGEARTRALSSAARATYLAHPNLGQVYESGSVGGTVFLVGEWCDGRNLPELVAELSQRGEGLTPPVIAHIISQAAYALEAAHNARDKRGTLLDARHLHIDPTSVVIGFDGGVKLVGFGMPAPEAPDPDADSMPSARLAYRAPEQVMGGLVDHRADIFSLGVCLYELLTGLRLHKRATVRGTVSAVLDERPTSLRASLPELPELLDVIVLRALEKRPEHRFQRARELASALESYIATCPETVNTRRMARLMGRLFPEGPARSPALTRDEEALAPVRTAQLADVPEPPDQLKRIAFTTAMGIGLMTLALIALSIAGAIHVGR
jgi:serine/threonine protein kinase